MPARNRGLRRDWPTLLLLAAVYAVWGLGTTWAAALWLPLGMALVIVTGVLHASITHEHCHGHPTRHEWINAGLVFPVLTLTVPYLRFRDTHLAHHLDSRLTDPYDDPESNYLDPALWARLPAWRQNLLRMNNTLAGRMVLGPVLGQAAFMAADARAIAGGDLRVLAGWALHVPAVAGVLWWMMAVGEMPLWAFLACVYVSNGMLKVRTFLEHQAHEKARGRTVVIEDRGIWAFLFLNNNLHVVHHMHPRVSWFRLPDLYAEHRDRYLRRNAGYRYGSYAEIFARHLWRAKDPVPHPLWSKGR